MTSISALLAAAFAASLAGCAEAPPPSPEQQQFSRVQLASFLLREKFVEMGEGGAFIPAAQPTARGSAAPPPAGLGIEWIAIPGGEFTMGSRGETVNERPAHRVTVKGFQIAKTAVTNKQYRACVEAGACGAQNAQCIAEKNGDNQPAVCVTWGQAKDFCGWVGGRLPSEAEWEYAARGAGKDIRYPWGNEEPTCAKAVFGSCTTSLMPVCSRPASNTQQGLCDMVGNAYQWTQDWFHDSYKGAPADGGAWEIPAGDCCRVIRGGNWQLGAVAMGVSKRSQVNPLRFGKSIGFRPVRGDQ